MGNAVRTMRVSFALLVVAICAIGASAQASRCVQNDTNIACTYNTVTMPETGRTVYWQLPLGTAPAKGWPVVLAFQGSFARAELFWSGNTEGILDRTFGAYTQCEVVKTLLDGGFAVLTPNAPEAGDTFWETNIPPFDLDWFPSSDHKLVMEMIAHLQAQTIFGPTDATHLFATGISSGGYMTSRMAVSLASYFRAAVVESGAYMVCGGPACITPDCSGVNSTHQSLPLPIDHPPTMFLHGLIDPVVPIDTMEAYHKKLLFQGTPTGKTICDSCWHMWIPEAPNVVLPWFRKYYDWTYQGDGVCPPKR